MKCHYITDEIAGKVFIPGCMGAAVHGPHGCTCRSSTTPQGYERESYNKEVKALREEISELEKENARLNRVIRKLLKRKR